MSTENRRILRWLSWEKLLQERRISEQLLKDFDITNLIRPGDLFPGYFYVATALSRRSN